ncbi:MAG: hypothetical protein ABI835_16960 [Chloroflexota bacterium]
MPPTEYTVQEHIAEMHRVAAQVRLAREVRNQPNRTHWLARLLTTLRRPSPTEIVEKAETKRALPKTAQPCGAVTGRAT